MLQILLVQCHGSIENERSFSWMNFIYSDIRNRLVGQMNESIAGLDNVMRLSM